MPSTIKSFCAFVLATFSLWSQAQKIDGYHNDIDTLRVWVDEIHPWPYSRCSKVEVDSAFSVAHASIDSTTEKFDFAKTIGEVLSVLKDSHTLLNIEQFQNHVAFNKGEFNLNLRYIDGKFYVLKDPENIIQLGSEVTEINDTPIVKYFNSALTIVPIEGNSYTSKVRLATILINDFALYEMEDGVKSISIETSKGEIIDYPIHESTPKKEKVKSVVDWVWPNEGDSIVKLKVKSFYDGKDGKYYRDLNKGFRKLKKSDYDHLVVDLRGNLGGSAGRMEYLFSYLTKEDYTAPEAIVIKQCKESKESFSKPYKGLLKWVVDKFGDDHPEMQIIKKAAILEIGGTDTVRFEPDNFGLKQVHEGQTCLLIDGLSASASVSFTSLYKKFNRGEILGESCMGPMTGTFGNSIGRTLQNSQIGVSIASFVFALDSNLSWHSTPISPNRFIQISPEEMKNEIDPFQSALIDWFKYPSVSSSYEFKTRESQILFSELETVYSLNRSWGDQVRYEVFNLVADYDSCIDSYNKKIKEVEKSNASEDEILLKVTELYKRKKTCVDMRNAKINLKLPPDLRMTFDQLIAPNRPAVLHFGIHNRADCNVCKK